jgi:hypothetical protein
MICPARERAGKGPIPQFLLYKPFIRRMQTEKQRTTAAGGGRNVAAMD